jgi:DNA recombination protein RmuC
VWQVDNRNQNAAVIATAAGRLYDKFVGFVDDMHELGRRLGQAQAGYAMAMSKLSDGRGNLMARAEQLRRRGAKTTRALPAELLDEEEVALLTAEQDALG